jgi:antitoxin StbD
MPALDMLDNIVPISDFNRGKSTQAFGKSTDGNPVFVMKRNVPDHVIVTVDDYRAGEEAKEDLGLLMLALQRMKQFDPSQTISRSEAMQGLRISEEDLAATPEPEFE